jgi:hypothetical protein
MSLATEFSLRDGCTRMAVGRTILAGVLLILLPLVLTSWLLPAFIPSSASPEMLVLESAFRDMALYIVVLGLLATVATFFTAYYHKGSMARALFGVVLALLLLIYASSLLSWTGLGPALEGVGAHLDLSLILALIAVIALLLAASYLGELYDERPAFKARRGEQVSRRMPRPESRLLDLDPRIGKIGAGMRGATRGFARYLALPVIGITIARAGIASNNSAFAQALLPVLDVMTATMFLFGLVLTVVCFFKYFYPKGCLGRTGVALVALVLVILYTYQLVLNDGLSALLEANGVFVDFSLLFLVTLVVILFNAVLIPGELFDWRPYWRWSFGRPWQAKPEEAKHPLWLDFRLRYGRFATGHREAKGKVTWFILVPVLLLIVIKAVLISLSNSSVMDLFASANMQVSFDQVISDLTQVTWNFLLLGIPVVIAVFIRGFYPKGSFSRLVFAWVAVGFTLLWIYFIFLGGRIGSDLGVGTVGLGFDLDFTALLALIMIASGLWGLYYSVEFFSYRKDWIANRYMPVLDRVRGRAAREERLRQAACPADMAAPGLQWRGAEGPSP